MTSLLHTTVTDARLIRHKPERRALVRYATTAGPMIGKLRANHRSTTPFKLSQALRSAGFDDHAPDFIRVPEPVAVFVNLGLWVQRLVPGTSLGELLEATEIVADDAVPRLLSYGTRLAQAAHKIHTAAVPTRRAHTIHDELRILRVRFERVAATNTGWRSRLTDLLTEFDTYAGILSDRPTTCIHRDFYPDQVITEDPWLTVLDFDLFCTGDPAVDLGNFAGHIAELGLRVHGDPWALQPLNQAMVATYLDLGGESHRAAIDIYTRLTLARHISLSTELAGRSNTTAAILDFVERWPAAPNAG